MKSVLLTVTVLAFINLSFAQVNHSSIEFLRTQSEKYYNKRKKEELATVRDDRPNIVFIMLDDARYDSFQSNGGWDFFPTPNIDRIANEGINFKTCVAVLPLCTPSRGTFFTGLYPHKHGAITNPDNIKGGIPWVSTILQASGYHTYMAGKLGFLPDSIQGFDEFLISTNDKYINPKFRYRGPYADSVMTISIDGHTTDIITDFAADFIARHAYDDEPFLIFLPHRAPHVPYIPRPQDDGILDNIIMPYPENAVKYSTNWPSYYYPWNESGDSIIQDSLYRGYFELLAGVEDNVGKILDTLESLGLLENTAIFFTSDNGNIKSEHLLQGKQLPLEESIKVPMFIRYPSWFSAGTIVDDQIASNIDWAPTLLDIAGIPPTYEMDGVSLRELANHSVTRHQIMYEVWRENETPTIRAVRTMNYNFIKSYCTDITEQFFDLANDPHENINLVNDPYYQPLIQYYRCKLDSMREALQDIKIDTVIMCKLKAKDSTHVGHSKNPGPIGDCLPFVSDAGGVVNVTNIEDHPLRSSRDNWDLKIYNLMGQLVFSQKYYSDFPALKSNFDPDMISTGIYIVIFESSGVKKLSKLLIE